MSSISEEMIEVLINFFLILTTLPEYGQGSDCSKTIPLGEEPWLIFIEDCNNICMNYQFIGPLPESRYFIVCNKKQRSVRVGGSSKKLVGQIVGFDQKPQKLVGQPLVNLSKTGGTAVLPAPQVPPALSVLSQENRVS